MSYLTDSMSTLSGLPIAANRDEGTRQLEIPATLSSWDARQQWTSQGRHPNLALQPSMGLWPKRGHRIGFGDRVHDSGIAGEDIVDLTTAHNTTESAP